MSEELLNNSLELPHLEAENGLLSYLPVRPKLKLASPQPCGGLAPVCYLIYVGALSKMLAMYTRSSA